MEEITIQFKTHRDQLDSYIKALAGQIHENFSEDDPDRRDDVHCLAELLKQLTKILPSQK